MLCGRAEGAEANEEVESRALLHTIEPEPALAAEAEEVEGRERGGAAAAEGEVVRGRAAGAEGRGVVGSGCVAGNCFSSVGRVKCGSKEPVAGLIAGKAEAEAEVLEVEGTGAVLQCSNCSFPHCTTHRNRSISLAFKKSLCNRSSNIEKFIHSYTHRKNAE
jgi:hypothetical protein